MDSIDRSILKMLQDDGKLTIRQLSASLELTTTPVFERIRRLEHQGYIKKHTVLLDRGKVGFSLMAFCSVSLDIHHTKNIEKFEEDVKNFPEVIECYHLAGMMDYLLKVVSEDIYSYQEFISKRLASLEYIGKVQSMVVMKEISYTTAFPL